MKLADKKIPLIMGILNVTPDSFHDGGRHNLPAQAKAAALKMSEAGADIIDIGGESTRPGSKPVSLEEECARVLPAFESIRKESSVPISLDTAKSELVRRALKTGPVEMVNDVTALRGDGKMAETVAAAGAELVLMHMRGTPETMQANPVYTDIIEEQRAFFEERIAFAQKAGIAKEKIWIDPGIGFGKKPEHNLEILRRLDELLELGCPILTGPSHKSFIGRVQNDMSAVRIWGTAAAVTVSILKGAKGVRVHDVEAMKQTARIAHAIAASKETVSP